MVANNIRIPNLQNFRDDNKINFILWVTQFEAQQNLVDNINGKI